MVAKEERLSNNRLNRLTALLATECNIPGGKEKCTLNLAMCSRLKFALLSGHSRMVHWQRKE